MSPFGNGKPREERRKAPRRDDDLSSEEVRHAEFWAKTYVKHKAALGALIGLATLVAGYVLAAYTLGPRVTKLEAQFVALSGRQDKLERNDELKTFIMCAMARESGTLLYPAECEAIIARRVKR